MRKFQGNQVKNGKVITVFRQVYSVSVILIESPLTYKRLHLREEEVGMWD